MPRLHISHFTVYYPDSTSGAKYINVPTLDLKYDYTVSLLSKNVDKPKSISLISRQPFDSNKTFYGLISR